MAKWPTSRAGQFNSAFAVAIFSAVVAFFWTEHSYLEQLLREPSTNAGQLEMSAFLGAARFAAITLFGVFVGVFFLIKLVERLRAVKAEAELDSRKRQRDKP